MTVCVRESISNIDFGKYDHFRYHFLYESKFYPDYQTCTILDSGWLTSVFALFILISWGGIVTDLVLKPVCLHCVNSYICTAVLQGLPPSFPFLWIPAITCITVWPRVVDNDGGNYIWEIFISRLFARLVQSCGDVVLGFVCMLDRCYHHGYCLNN